MRMRLVTQTLLSMQRLHWRPPVWDCVCPHCQCHLLTGERPGFCCTNGKTIPEPLLPLPPWTQSLCIAPMSSRWISHHSHHLSNLFSFTTLGSTGGFLRFAGGPASISVTGQTYHRLFNVTDNLHSLHWYLYDQAECQQSGINLDIPLDWTHMVTQDLDDISPYVDVLREFNTV